MKMPENIPKLPQAESPIAKVGGGDISEWELSRERYTLQTTPTARVQPAHPKRQLFSVPLKKFSGSNRGPSANLERIRSCLDEFSRTRAPPRAPPIHPKAISMEDLTPTKRTKREESHEGPLSAGLRSIAEEEAAARIGRFMLVQAWRRRRRDVRCLRKTLETQVSCSERLRVQVATLKSLLDSDNAKVRLAMRELERLKQLLRDKDVEKHVLEREKIALEQDLCATEDKVAELSTSARAARDEAERARGLLARCEAARAAERLAAHDARAQCERAAARISELSSEAGAARAAAGERQRLLDETRRLARMEQQAHNRSAAECASLALQLAGARAEVDARAAEAGELRALAAALQAELARVRTRLEWWPAPMTRMMGMARAWLRRPLSAHDAIVWALVPARHGCN